MSCLWECLCSSLQHNHFFCNKNTNPDLRPSSGLGKRKESKKLLAGNRLCVFKSKLSIYVNSALEAKHISNWESESSQTLGLNLYISSQCFTMDFSASAKSGLKVLWDPGRQLEYQLKYFALCFSLKFLWVFVHWIYYSKRAAADPSKTYKPSCLYVTGR